MRKQMSERKRVGITLLAAAYTVCLHAPRVACAQVSEMRIQAPVQLTSAYPPPEESEESCDSSEVYLPLATDDDQFFVRAPAPVGPGQETVTFKDIVVYHTQDSEVSRNGLEFIVQSDGTEPIHCGDYRGSFRWEVGGRITLLAETSLDESIHKKAFANFMKAANGYCRLKYSSYPYARLVKNVMEESPLEEGDLQDETKIAPEEVQENYFHESSTFYAYEISGVVKSCDGGKANNGIARFSMTGDIVCSRRAPC